MNNDEIKKLFFDVPYRPINKLFFNYDLPIKYIVNNGACILFWGDGTKSIVKRAKDDDNDVVKGFLWAYFEKHSGLSKTKANKYLRDVDYSYEPNRVSV